MALNSIFYFSTLLILTTYGSYSVNSENIFSSIRNGFLELFGGKKEIPQTNVNMFEDFLKAIRERDDQIEKLNSILDITEQQLQKVRSQAKKCFPKANSCLPFGNSSGIHQIYTPGLDKPFYALCDSEVAGPGWLVIQQRINGDVNFERNFANYSQGFGSLEGNFFIGLEKIHQLTSAHRHELFVYYITESDFTIDVRYDQFEVGSKTQQYKLLSLGKNYETMNRDVLRDQENMLFYTMDRDNYINCSSTSHSGWWFNSCGNCNLNRPYNGIPYTIQCGHYYELKYVKMLIRPKMD